MSPEDTDNPLVKKIRALHATDDHSALSYVYTYAISPDGKQIVYGINYPYKTAQLTSEKDTWRSYYGLYYCREGVECSKRVASTGSFDSTIVFPHSVKYWLNNSRVLLVAEHSNDSDPLSVVLYDVSTLSGSVLPINADFFSTPVPYESNTKLFRHSILRGGGRVNVDLRPSEYAVHAMYSYDLAKKVEAQVFSIPKEVLVKMK